MALARSNIHWWYCSDNKCIKIKNIGVKKKAILAVQSSMLVWILAWSEFCLSWDCLKPPSRETFQTLRAWGVRKHPATSDVAIRNSAGRRPCRAEESTLMYRIDVPSQPWQRLSEYAHTLRYHRRQHSTSTSTLIYLLFSWKHKKMEPVLTKTGSDF
jgi:hypothetical protein